MELESHTLQLMGVYRSIYNRLVRPDVTLPVRDYFLTRWAPRLGGDLSLLIIQLRRLCLSRRMVSPLSCPPQNSPASSVSRSAPCGAT